MEWHDKWYEAIRKTQDLYNHHKITNAILAFSGGKDSAVCLRLLEEAGVLDRTTIIFNDTRMEFEATYKFIDEMKKKYNIITLHDAIPQPIIYRDYGFPLISKLASTNLEILQKNGFDWNDVNNTWQENYEKYGRMKSQFRWLASDFKMQHAPKYLIKAIEKGLLNFRISNKCCELSKKVPFKNYIKKNNVDLNIIGVRQDEGGVRAIAMKNCFKDKGRWKEYYPILHFTDNEIWEIIKEKQIPLSDCYTVYGLKRTGCVGCPFSLDWKKNLDVLKKYEPNKYNYAYNMYKDVYKIQELKYQRGKN